MNQKFEVTGMTCSACSAHIEKNVSKLQGMNKVSVNLLTNSMQTEYDEKQCDIGKIIETVEKAGYGAEAVTSAGNTGGQRSELKAQERYRFEKPDIQNKEILKGKAEKKQMKSRLGISIVFLVLLMYLSMHHMFQMWFGLPVPGFMITLFHGNENALIFALTQFLLVLPILYVNRKYFTVGFKTLFHLNPNMDSLIAIGTAASVLYGIFAIYRIGFGLGHGAMALVEQYVQDLYFESAGTILTLVTVGKYLETRSKGKTSEAITGLMNLSPQTAFLISGDGVETEIPVEDMQAGDVFLLKPGSLVPADGVVVEGLSSINEAAITGESIPVEKREGDKVISATLNRNGALKCRALRVGQDTTLAQIIRLVEEAASSKAPIARMADKIAGIFVPIVILIALLTLGGWMFAGASFEFAMSAATAVLVISCPCALGLATPVAIMIGTGVGAQNGILIKSGEALQIAGEIDTVVLDKTGTITEGRPKVTDFICYDEALSREEVLVLAGALEKASEHPLAEAIVTAAEEIGKRFPMVTDFEAVFGKGVMGRILTGAGEQRFYYAGNVGFLEEKNIMLTLEQKQCMDNLAKKGKTPLLFAAENGFLGIIAVADAVKESSVAAIKEFKKMKIDIVMLTGDNKRTAEAVMEKLELSTVIAEVLPQDKEKEIRKLQEQGKKVAMVGDGINDAPALVAADVGIAIGAGTDVALESADMILIKNRLTDVVTAISLSRKVIRNIKENLFWAFFYNSVGIPLAAGLLYPIWGIKLSPMYGAAAMSLSSLFVVGNALRLRNFKVNKLNLTGEIFKNKEEKKKNEEKEKEGMTKIVKIEGMSCGHCTGRVQKVLEGILGVVSVTVSLEDKNAIVELKEGVSNEILTAAVTEAGYDVVGIR